LRLSSTTFDYDLNGVVDATMTYAYDAEGRMIKQTYTYTGDDAADLGNPLFGDEDFVIDTVYEEDRMLTESATYGPEGSPTSSYVITVTYGGDGMANRLVWDDTRYSDSGPVTSRSIIDYEYTDGLMTKATMSFEDFPDFSSERRVTYDSKGYAIDVEFDVYPSGVGRATYVWNDDGTLAEWRSYDVGESTPSSVLYYTYDDGLPTEFLWDYDDGASVPDEYYKFSSIDGSNRVTVDYDHGNDGTNDGKEVGQLEEGACMTVTYPITFPLVMVPVAKASSTARLNYCYP